MGRVLYSIEETRASRWPGARFAEKNGETQRANPQ